jgi:acyl-CoA thioester hydrolase
VEEIQVIVRFGETDALGHVNNTSYFIYLEEARIRFIESLGFDMNVECWNFILASTKLDFINQGFFNQVLTIKTYVSKVGTKSFELMHEVNCSQTGELIAKGNAIMVYFDFDLQRSAQIPEEIREQLAQHFISLK